MKKLALYIFMLVQFVSIYAQDSYTNVKQQLDSLLRDDYFKTCIISVQAHNLSEDVQIYKANERLLLRPASNEKVMTTAAGLLFLGEDYSFTTSVYYTGEIKDSVCTGDLYFVGGCDPDFTSADLAFVVAKIKEMGINKIAGKIYGDVSAMDDYDWGEGWMWDDDPSSDFPHLSPLIINDACIKIAYQPGEIGKKPIVEGIPQSSFYKLENNALTTEVKGERFRVTRDWLHRTNNFIATGNLLVTATPDTDKINVYNSTGYFMSLAVDELLRQGIKVNTEYQINTMPEDGKLIYSFERLFGEVIVNLNKTSDNLSAEMTLRAMAVKYFGKPATASNGIKLVDSLVTLTGLNPNNYSMVDGSGISHYNLISAELLENVVRYIYKKDSNLYEILYNSFPIGGVDGTLRGRMQNENIFNNVHAKTGTLSGVSTLTGYMKAKNGDIISFSIMTQNFVGSAKTVRGFQDKVCEILYNINE